jgi:hypothetical protein
MNSSVAARSLLWMFLRTVVEPNNHNEFQETVDSTFISEFSASQICFSRVQIFDYEDLAGHSDIERPLAPPWAAFARQVARNFAYKIRRFHDLYPAVQRSKCTSRESGQLYQRVYPEAEITKVTTRDLEVHYGHTGHEIHGGCELRMAWKFNDLKPRFYYAQGGFAYFKSRYMKPFAVALMESIRSTREHLRRDPANLLSVHYLDFFTLWDFKAFTTNLSELKFFLYHLIQGVYETGVSNIFVIDYHQGKIELDPIEMLNEYNEHANVQDLFSICRVIDRVAFNLDDTINFYQQNSGMLGVAGNIGFSTACHGYHVCRICKEGSCVCVGDDACGATEDDPELELIPEMLKLGVIERSKFFKFYPEDSGPGRFLKRGLWREGSLFMNFLLNIPLSIYADANIGQRTCPPKFGLDDRRFKIASQTGSLWWKLNTLSYEYQFTEDDLFLLRSYLKIIYSALHLPVSGSVPGFRLFDENKRPYSSTYFIPPITDLFDPRVDDWADYLLTRFVGYITIPVITEEFTPTLPLQGDVCYMPYTRGIRVLEDLGILKTSEMRNRLFVHSDVSRLSVIQYLRGNYGYRKLVEVIVTHTIPDHWTFMFQVPTVVEALHTEVNIM